MAKVELTLYKWKTLSNETNPIMLRVSKDKKRIMFATGLSCVPKQWNDEYGLFVNDKRVVADHENLNKVLKGITTKADDIIKEFDRLKIDWTLKQFSNAYKKKETVKLNPAGYFENHIQKLRDAGKFGNADMFHSTLAILRIFRPKFDKLEFPDIDRDFIQDFDTFLRLERNAKDTTISVYMRTFATLLNAAIADDLMQPGAYPFSKSKWDKGYKISELNTKTKKRFIPVEYLQKLRDFNFDDLRLETARNLFLFSFYCRGINWIDMAYLTPDNVEKTFSKDGKPIKVINYIRAKTHKPFDIKINSDIQKLLDWFKSMPHCEPYLLPIVTKPEHTGEALRQHIRDRRSKYNKALADIVKIDELAFPESLQKITSYYSRHSYAMRLRETGKNVELISEALGHADLTTTNIYLDSFGRDAVAAASEGLI
jgi:hypothetical protein